MSKISAYANSVASLGTDDLLDVSEKISSSPDVYESRKMTGTVLAAFISSYASNILNTNGLTLGGNYSHDFSGNVLTFQNAGLAIEGAQTITAGAAGSVDMFNLYDNGASLLHRFNTTFTTLYGQTQVSSEVISLQDRTLIKGPGTAGTSIVLDLYNSDTTPANLWSWRSNGDLYGYKAKANLIAQNATANSDADYILRLRNSADTSNFLFVGNGAEIRLGNGVTDTSTGDKSSNLLWSGGTVTRAGTGNYSILFGHSIDANFSGNDAIGIGRTIDINNQRQIGIGENVNLVGEHAYGIGRTIDIDVADSYCFGKALTNSAGTYSILIGAYLESTASKASLIGNGNTSTAAKLVNNTANSCGFGWDTTTPYHLLKSDGAIFGGQINMANLPTYADDTAAGVGGLTTGDLYVETTSGNRYVASKS